MAQWMTTAPHVLGPNSGYVEPNTIVGDNTRYPVITPTPAMAPLDDEALALSQQSLEILQPGCPGYAPPPQAIGDSNLPPESGIVPTPPPSAPVNVDVPAIMIADTLATAAKVGDVLVCTKGNWNGEPTTYTFQWRNNTIETGDTGDHYTVQTTDRGDTIDCIVTATNPAGSTQVASNKINIAATR